MLRELLTSVPSDLARQIQERFNEILTENDTLRAILAKSDLDCVYCGLPADQVIKCIHGFPGCSRLDDVMHDPREELNKALVDSYIPADASPNPWGINGLSY